MRLRSGFSGWWTAAGVVVGKGGSSPHSFLKTSILKEVVDWVVGSVVVSFEPRIHVHDSGWREERLVKTLPSPDSGKPGVVHAFC